VGGAACWNSQPGESLDCLASKQEGLVCCAVLCCAVLCCAVLCCAGITLVRCQWWAVLCWHHTRPLSVVGCYEQQAQICHMGLVMSQPCQPCMFVDVISD
jgi:hypothetical protein